MTSATNAPASNTCMTDLPNDMWLAVAGKLLKNLDILTAHPTRQSLASLIGLSVHEAGRIDRGVYGSYQRPEQSDRQPVPVRDAVAEHGRHRQATAQGECTSGICQQIEAKEQQ